MRLPKDIFSETYVKPRFFLCETDKTRICELEVCNASGSFKFNSVSELTFDVPRVYNNMVTGETTPHPFYNKIEALRLIEVENMGYFELQGPELTSDGIEEMKSCMAYSLEYTLSQKYLENFYVNRGTVDSIEVINAVDPNKITPIVLYNSTKQELSLLHLILEKMYGWTIGHVDASLKTLSRQFEVDRASIYDFLINEVCEKFNCYIEFDTIQNKINVYAESPTAKFIGDGKTNTFTIGSISAKKPLFSSVKTVSVDGYKTTRWSYVIQDNVGILYLEDTPAKDAMIEAVGVDSTWETDVFVTFDNLSQEINVDYDADSIKTVLSVTYGDDYDIREVNLGLPYLTDLSYYYTIDWMGEELYKIYTDYLRDANNSHPIYIEKSKSISKINDQIYYAENRLSLEYSIAQVDGTTVGTYYTKQQDTSGNYYYTEVSLPTEYKVGVSYYSNVTTNVDETKISSLYAVLKKYYYGYFRNKNTEMSNAVNELRGMRENFEFLGDTKFNTLVSDIQTNNRDSAVKTFLNYLWGELGRTPLTMLYLKPYQLIKQSNVEAGWNLSSSDNYGQYYPVTLMISSLESAIAQRNTEIELCESTRSTYENENRAISESLVMETYFQNKYKSAGYSDTQSKNLATKLLVRLNSFLREDELHLDDIVQTSQDDLSSSFKVKQDAMESGRIELQKLCQPQLQFSMTMANIYALPEFEPIIDQFQLGKIIRVGLRPDYIKQSRLLQVNINFDNYSDFSCEFGELTNLRTQSDIHADLLSQALSAGKSVATNSNYWTRGSDQATATDLKIQQGLLDATTQIKSIDGTQGVVIDKYGILLQKLNPDGSADPHQTRIVNNMILMTDDNWATSRTGLGQFNIEGLGEFYGLLADAVIAGYIEGSTIVGSTIEGGTINIGNGAFMVAADGTVTMGKAGGAALEGYLTEDTVDSYVKQEVQNEVADIKDKVDKINTANGYQVEITAAGSTIISTTDASTTLTCKVYEWGQEITDTLTADKFHWKRISGNMTSDTTWSNNHTGTKTIIITHVDIEENSSFTCEVDLPETTQGGV